MDFSRRPTPTDYARSAERINWPGWLRGVERKRRLLARQYPTPPRSLPRPFYANLTYSSFRLEELELTRPQVDDALALKSGRRLFRSRQLQRVRNHVAILHWLDSFLRRGQPLRASTVLRWYTSISSGLSTNAPAEPTLQRLDEAVRRVNSPPMRLQLALQEIARLHVALLVEPLVPSFNGILARLLLRFHLGRCALPPPIFDPSADAACLGNESSLLERLLELIDASYNLLLDPAAAIK